MYRIVDDDDNGRPFCNWHRFQARLIIRWTAYCQQSPIYLARVRNVNCKELVANEARLDGH